MNNKNGVDISVRRKKTGEWRILIFGKCPTFRTKVIEINKHGNVEVKLT